MEERRYGLRPTIKNFDELFSESVLASADNKGNPIIILNEIPGETEEEISARKDFMYNIYEEETLDILPRCACVNDPGIIPGEFNLGRTCPKCDTVVARPYTSELSTQRWIKVPDGVNYFINPQVWAILNAEFGSGKSSAFSVLRWLTDTKYHFNNGKRNIRLEMLEQLDIPRGYNYFCDNFFDVIKLLMSKHRIGKRNQKQQRTLLDFLMKYKDSILCKHIPLPDKTLFTMEMEPNKIKVDKNLTPLLEGILNLLNVDSDPYANQRAVENSISTALINISDYYHVFGSESVDPKPGISRKQIVGTREPFTARGIIGSMWDVHKYNNIIPSWQIAVGLFRLHLINKMTKEGIPLRKQYDILHTYTHRANKTLYRMLREIINVKDPDEGDIGYPCEFNRNPTLNRLSGQYLLIADVSKDPDIKAIFFSVLALAGCNADPSI